MCLAVPARIIELLPGDMARAEVGGVVKELSLCLVDDVAVGDFVIVHVGFALSRLEPEEAEATLALFAEAGMLTEDDEGVPVEDRT
ncbi:MAG: HypC/HybG/HupF family hydrogenase formation chaperone [Defluviicoccus sp.]|nr:MAG: HypC/HybG/HupF family hydrogenase formation chaperone [Defluviicoccus sp.]